MSHKIAQLSLDFAGEESVMAAKGEAEPVGGEFIIAIAATAPQLPRQRLRSIAKMKLQGSAASSPETLQSLVATRDVGTAAARLLAEGGSGKRVIELAGPREYTPRDVAAAVGRIVGKPIDVQQAPEEAMAPALMGAGMNAGAGTVSRATALK